MNETTTGGILPAPKRVLLILLVAISLAALNQLVDRFDAVSTWAVVALSVFYIVQVGFISLFCGLGDDPTWLKWTTFVWIFFLIDAELVARMPELSVQGHTLPLAGLFVSQFGLLTTLLVMGSSHFVRRIAVTIPPLICLALLFADSEWILLLSCLVTPLAIVQVILRVFGFRLLELAPGGQTEQVTSRQFSLRDAMILMTVLAVVMAALKSQEVWLTEMSKSIWNNGTPAGLIVVLGFTSAITAVFACWASLGSGKPVVRYGVLLSVVTAAGIGVSLWACHIMDTIKVSMTRGNLGWSFVQYQEMQRLRMFAEGEWQWLTWYVSSGCLLVASLIFLRAQGLRFMRVSRD